MEIIQGGVTAAKGFKAAGMNAGIKNKTKKDMAMIFSEKPCVTAGTFTTNKVFKGGNLKEKSYELIKDNAEFEDKDNKYIYTFKNLTTNKVKIGWKVRVEN